mgnify:CR=1 FL=1
MGFGPSAAGATLTLQPVPAGNQAMNNGAAKEILVVEDEEAIAEYSEGAKLAGDLDLTPTMAAVTKLTSLAKKAPDEAKGTLSSIATESDRTLFFDFMPLNLGTVAGMKIAYEDWDDATASKGSWTAELESANAKKAIERPT